MRMLWAGVAVSGLLVVSAEAETQYDRRLEQAVMDIVAGRIGDIRGGFSFDARLVLITTPEAEPAGPAAMRGTYSVLDPWRDGLAPAVERTVPRGVF